MPRPLAALSLVSLTALFAQTPQLTFEVASVKPSGPRPPGPMPAAGTIAGGPGTADPGQLTFSRVAMKRILVTAFEVQNDQILGPAWLEDNSIDGPRFDIAAKVPPGITKADANIMLQNLLAERFHLTYHRDKKDFPVYELVVAKSGSKLKDAAPADGPLPPPPQPGTPMPRPTAGPDGFPELPAGRPNMVGMGGKGAMRLTARMSTPAALLGLLQLNLGTGHLVDKTGLTGKYDFKLEFSTAGSAGPPATLNDVSDPVPDLFTALEKQLGLKLEKTKSPLDVIVIDRLEKIPTEN